MPLEFRRGPKGEERGPFALSACRLSRKQQGAGVAAGPLSPRPPIAPPRPGDHPLGGWVPERGETPLGSRGSRTEPEGSGASLRKDLGTEVPPPYLWLGIGANPPPPPASGTRRTWPPPPTFFRPCRQAGATFKGWVPGRIRKPGQGPHRLGSRGDSRNLRQWRHRRRASSRALPRRPSVQPTAPLSRFEPAFASSPPPRLEKRPLRGTTASFRVGGGR